jgi:hypothetical protein
MYKTNTVCACVRACVRVCRLRGGSVDGSTVQPCWSMLVVSAGAILWCGESSPYSTVLGLLF